MALLFMLLFVACGGGSSTSNSNNGGTNTPKKPTTPISPISSWNVSDALAHNTLVKKVTINGDVCTITQDENGISYICEGNLSSNRSFSYDTIASAIASDIKKATSTNTKDIVVAESNVTNENFSFFAPPIIYKGMMYGSWGGYHTVKESTLVDGVLQTNNVQKELLHVDEYNLSKFNHDIPLEALISNHIYSSDVVRSYLAGNTIPTNLIELDGYLYFTARSKNTGNVKVNTTHGTYYEMLKYAPNKKEFIYDKVSKPLFVHYYMNDGCPSPNFNGDYVAIAQGWMVPSSGTNIAFLHGERETQISMCSGLDVMVSEMDGKCAYSSLVQQNETQYTDPFTLSVSNPLYYYAINGDTITQTAFNRQGKTYTGLSSVDKRVDVLDDFKAHYTGSTTYQSLQLLNAPVMDQMQNKIYMLGVLAQKSKEDYQAYMDLYLFEYDTDLHFLSAHKITQSKEKILLGGVNPYNHLYKYNNKIFFVYANSMNKPKLYAYNLNTYTIDYTYTLANNLRPSAINPLDGYDYAITGNTIIMPQNIKLADDATNNHYQNYQLSFDVIDINTGKLLKRITHPSLKILGGFDYKIAVQSAYVYANNVYFVIRKKYNGHGDDYTRNILVKINAPHNVTQVTRYRGDSRLNGVIRSFEVTSNFKPKNEEQKLIYNLYNFLNTPASSSADLKVSLLNTITKEKGLTSTAQLFIANNTAKTYTAYKPTYTPVTLSKDFNYSQTTPLYNQELVTNTQKFYIPLLKKVTYSSSNDGSDLGEARIKINTQYACTKAYFNFPAHGSVKILGFNPTDDSFEFKDKNNMPQALSFYPKIPMLMVDYSNVLNDQTLLRYGIDAIEHDSLDTIEQITETIKSNLDSLISTGISIVTGNYASAICSTANIITNMTVDNLQTGDTYYGSAMKIYTGNSNYGIDNTQNFKADYIEGSATSYTIDADSAGNVVEGICSGLSLDPVALYSFVTKADIHKKHISAEVTPTWHKGIVIKHLKVTLVDTQFFNQKITPITQFHPGHTFDVDGYIGTLGTQEHMYAGASAPYRPFNDQISIYEHFTQGDPFHGWNYKNKTLLNIDYSTNAAPNLASMAGVYIEMVFYSDSMQMGVFSDTLFLDEAIYTNNFTKNGKDYSITLTKPFMFPDGSLNFKKIINGNVTYKVTFTVK